MTDQEAMDIALFRYAIIAPVAAEIGDHPTKISYFREAAKESYTVPGTNRKTTFTAETIKKWYLNYKKNGLQGLKPKARIDLGKSRLITPEIASRIMALKTQFPRITGQKIWEKMVAEGTIKATDLSVDTVQRFLKNLNLNGPPPSTHEHLAFEFAHVNDCWQTDTVDGPKIIDADGNKRDTYLISIHDDHSRKNMKGMFFYEDNAVNMRIVFKKAVKIGGVPKMLMMDNGGTYKNKQLMEICAELGVGDVYLRPYAPEGKGKEERSHRTVIMRFMDCEDFSDCHDLESLNAKYDKYINEDYNQAVNRMTQSSPNDRFMKEYDYLKFVDSDKLDIIFLDRDKRTLNANSCIQFHNALYEVPQEYILSMKHRKDKIKVRYDPEDFTELYIIDENSYKVLYVLKPVNLVGNSQRKRKALIDYSVAVV